MGGVGLVFGIVMLIAGVAQLISNKKNKDSLTTSYVFAGCSIVYGVLLLLIEFLATESLSVTIFISGFGLMMLIMVIAAIYNKFNCTETVEAEFVRAKYYSRGMYQLIFKYRYDLEEYEKPTLQAYSDRYIMKHYVEGEKYEIYVCPTKPAINTIHRKISVAEIFLAIMGTVFFVLGLMPYLRPDSFGFKL